MIPAAASSIPEVSAGTTRVLYLTHHLPWPPLSGGTLREYQLLTKLAQHFTIDLLAIGRTDSSAAPEKNPLGLASAEFLPDEAARTTRRQRHSAKARQRIQELAALGQIDAIHVEGGYLFHLVPAELHDRTCLVEHNIESDVLGQFAQITGDVRLLKASRRVNELEERAWRATGAVITVTPEDRHRVAVRSGRQDIHLVPNGCDHIAIGSHINQRPDRPPTALLLANFAYGPNRDALDWLIDEVWPLVATQLPTARLLLAGSGLSEAQHIRAAAVPGVVVRGIVDDVGPVLDEADVLLSPLRAGGGIKVKVVEALRRGCPVVTTPIGAQGIHGAARRALCIEEQAAGLARRAIQLLSNHHDRERVRSRTLSAGLLLPTWQQAASTMTNVWTEVAARHARA